MSIRTQQHRSVRIRTPLEDDALLIQSMTGSERLGRPYQFELVLLSENHDLNYRDVIGQKVTVSVDKATEGPRFFNGYISRFAQTRFETQLVEYHATVVPWLWFLSRSSDCRMFQDMTVPEILLQVFRDHGMTDFDNRLHGQYEKREFCVQYRETAFNFISRLMEQEGIYYYFKHEDGKHTLILCDSISSHLQFAGYEELTYRPSTEASSIQERLWSFVVRHEVQPGAYVLKDFDFENPHLPLVANSTVDRGHALSSFEHFDYPGLYTQFSEGERYSRLRIQEHQARYETFEGEGDARGICTGVRFTMRGHPLEELCREYLTIGADYRIQSDAFQTRAEATNQFVFEAKLYAIDSAQPFRTQVVTAQALIHGPQTAIVVGPELAEIHTDKYGRVRLQFHWDRRARGHQDSSCWVRVAQVWAGRKWGSLFMPRVGQEVVVEFLEGNPDKPIVTGRLYNAAEMPPYDLPNKGTVSTIKSHTSPGGEGFNELRFEDRKGAEQVMIHSQGRMDVRVRSGLYETAGGNREERVGSQDQGDHNSLVCGDINHQLKGGQYEAVEKVVNAAVKDDVVEDFQKNQTTAVKERATLNSLELVIEAESVLSLKSDKVIAQGAAGLHLKAGAVHIEGTQQIHLKSGGNFVVIDAGGVTIKGTLVKINSGGSAQPAEGPLEGQNPTIEDPLEAASATTALPGLSSGGGASRRRRRREITLRRAPEPPPPPRPGMVGWGHPPAAAANDEIELVEVVEVAYQRATQSITTQAPENRRQFVNLDPSSATGDHPRDLGRVTHLKARLRWRTGDPNRPLTGNTVYWYYTPGADNRERLVLPDMKEGFDSAGGPARKSVPTDAEGWTSVVQFHVSRYGGDTFSVFATLDPNYAGGLAAGRYEVWRRVFFEIDCMTRKDGGSYDDNLQTGDMVSTFATHFIDCVSTGSPPQPPPPYQRVITRPEVSTWILPYRNGGGAPLYFQLALVDTVANTSAPVNAPFHVRRGTWQIRFPSPHFTLDARGKSWLISAQWRDTVTGATGSVEASQFSDLREAGTYAGDDDGMETDVDLSAAGSAPENELELNVTVRNWHYLSGLQAGSCVYIAMRWREQVFESGLAQSVLNTMLHEPGHFMGLAAPTLPDGDHSPYFLSTSGGPHCASGGHSCVMWTDNSTHLTFCDDCSDALKGRKLVRACAHGRDPGYA